jgi:hypothetical protein
MDNNNIITTDGTVFTLLEHVDLARLVFKRFGHDLAEATDAWRRLMSNDTEEADLFELIAYPEHTTHCEGNCCLHNHDPAGYDYNAAKRAANME